MTSSAVYACLEIGSTYSKLVTFRDGAGRLTLIGRSHTRTTLGDVRQGARQLLHHADYGGRVGPDAAYLSSSAGGGLRIAVCGLTPTLSTKVAREVALSAGGVIVYSSSGRLSTRDLERMRQASPGLVLVTGGTDDGESATVLYNLEALAGVELDAIFIFAGNCRVRSDAEEIFVKAGRRFAAADNVYPESDRFHFDEVRDIVRICYERDVVKAPGVDELRHELGTGCLPTPLAVSRVVEQMGRRLGDLLALDIGGATTDVHSYVHSESERDTLRAAFEPRLKRTVEGDLGVFHNLGNLLLPGEVQPVLDDPILDGDLVGSYALRAAKQGLARHCGRSVQVHGAGGLRQVVYGSDLRGVGTVIATGGALSYGLHDASRLGPILQELGRTRLAPDRVHTWLIDRRYLMSSLGCLLPEHTEAVGRFIDEGLKEGIWS